MTTASSRPLDSAPRQLETAAREHLQAGPALPLPGCGGTLERWRALAALGAKDLALAKVLEAHHDAVAILVDLGARRPEAGDLHAVWAAEGPQSTVSVRGSPGSWLISGRKPWCSGARFVDGALLTACNAQGQRLLVQVALQQPGITQPQDGRWQAVGMATIESGTVEFDAVPCVRVGAPGAYLSRPGFWHSGAGIAACWYGAAVSIAQRMAEPHRVQRDPHLAANLGRVDMALGASAALLRELATRIDAAPDQAWQRDVLRLRSQVERTCTAVIDAAGRSLGPAPLCTDGAHARRCADLTVFMRQSHAERDWAALGQAVAEMEADARWPL